MLPAGRLKLVFFYTCYSNRSEEIEFYYDFLMKLPGEVQNTVTGPSRRVALYQPGPGENGSFKVKHPTKTRN